MKNGKKVIIIGGGIAGLSAGIHAQMDGFETEIYESHFKPGGMCTTWTRSGYKIDNCVHWFSCCNPGFQLYKQWVNCGLAGDDVPRVHQQLFYTSELNGQKITLWSDLERTRKEMLELSPEDADAINDFIETTKLETGMQLPTFKPITAVGLFDLPKILNTMKPMIKAIKHIGKGDITDYTSRFKHPLLKLVISDFVPNTQYATSFIASYATIACGNGDYPIGGSEKMIENMVARYESLGGKLYCKAPVASVKLEGSAKKSKITSVTLENGTELKADAFIFATDPHVTFHKFLDYSYMPKGLKTRYENKKGNPTFTGFHIAFAVDGIFDAVEGAYFYQLKTPIKCANKTVTRMNIKTYHEYGEGFAPEGHDILQTHFKMDEESWKYWTDLREKNPEAYKAEKMRIAKEALADLENHFPAFKGKISIIDTWTPATYTRYTGAYTGSYMTFVKTEDSGANYIPNTIKGISNAFLASNWLMSPGGLPCAVAEGYFASWYLKRAKI